MDFTEVIRQANILAKQHIKEDNFTTNIWISPHPEEIRLLEVSASSPSCGEIMAWKYAPAPDYGIDLPSVVILIHPDEWEMIQRGELQLPDGWDIPFLTSLYNGKDPRKTELKKDLRQLNIRQLKRIINYPGEMVLEEDNYQDGKFCPLAVALGLDRTLENPSNDKVSLTLTDLGYEVNYIKGVVGKFYTDHRKEDLLETAQEVLEEKLELDAGY